MRSDTPILITLLLILLAILAPFFRPRKEQGETPTLNPPSPSTTPEDLTRLDDALPPTPTDPVLSDLVEWADAARDPVPDRDPDQ